MTFKIPKPLRPLARQAIAAGWTIHPTRSGHLAWRSPTGRRVFTGSSPGDHRAVRNHRAMLRRAGLAVGPG